MPAVFVRDSKSAVRGSFPKILPGEEPIAIYKEAALRG